MFRLLRIYRDPEAASPSGGVAPAAQVSAPQAASSQPGSAANPPSGDPSGQAGGQASPAPSTYTSDFFEGLEKMSSEELDAKGVKTEDLDAYGKWVQGGRKKTEPQVSAKTPDKPEDKTPDPKPAKATTPEGKLEDAQGILDSKSPSKYTDAEAKTIAEAMEQVGAKSVTELREKIKGLRDLAGEKGGMAGRLQQQVDNFEAFIARVSQGDPKAIEMLQSFNPNITLKQMTAAVEKSNDQAAAQPQKPAEVKAPEGVIDEALYGHLTGEISKMREVIETLRSELDNQRKSVTEREAQTAEMARKNEAYSGYIEQCLQLVDEFPEDFKPETGNVRRMLHEYFYSNVTDPRLEPFLSLFTKASERKIGTSKGLYDLRATHMMGLHESGTFTQRLVEAERRGRESALKGGSTQGFASVRDQSPAGSGNAAPQYTEEDGRAIMNGDKPIPREWFTNGMVDRAKAPAHLHKILGFK